MKTFSLVILLLNFFIFSKCSYLRGSDTKSLIDSLDSENPYSNSLIPRNETVEKLKKVIESLVVKLDEVSMTKDNMPHFKYCKIYILLFQ